MPETGGVKAYARHRKALGWPGGTPPAVRKADGRQQVVWVSEGVIDFAATDAKWPPDPSTARDANVRSGPATSPEPVRRPARGEPTGGTAAVGSPQVRNPNQAGNDKLTAQAQRESANARIRLRELARLEGRLMDTDRGMALMMDVVGLIRDRGDALPDAVTDDLGAMVEDLLREVAAGEDVVFDRAAVHALLADAVREIFEGAADTIAALRAQILDEAAPG